MGANGTHSPSDVPGVRGGAVAGNAAATVAATASCWVAATIVARTGVATFARLVCIIVGFATLTDFSSISLV